MFSRKYLHEGRTDRLIDWLYFEPKFDCSFFLEKFGYFDERPKLHITLTGLILFLSFPPMIVYTFWYLILFPFIFIGWGSMIISIPIKTGINKCESPSWGVSYHNDVIWLYIGGDDTKGREWWSLAMPWEFNWHRTSILLENGDWEHNIRGSKNFFDTEWEDLKMKIETIYHLDDGRILKPICTIEEREWRMKWMKWTPLFCKIRRYLCVDYGEEIKPKGSSRRISNCSFPISKDKDYKECMKELGFWTINWIRDKKLDEIL